MQTQTIQSLHDSPFMRLLGQAQIIRDAVPKDTRIRRRILFTRDLTAQEHHTRSTVFAAVQLVNL